MSHSYYALYFQTSDTLCRIAQDPGPLPHLLPTPTLWDCPMWPACHGMALSPGVLPHAPPPGAHAAAAVLCPCSAQVGPRKPCQKSCKEATGTLATLMGCRNPNRSPTGLQEPQKKPLGVATGPAPATLPLLCMPPSCDGVTA